MSQELRWEHNQSQQAAEAARTSRRSCLFYNFLTCKLEIIRFRSQCLPHSKLGVKANSYYLTGSLSRPWTARLRQTNQKIMKVISPDVQKSWDRPSSVHTPHTFEHLLKVIHSARKVTSAMFFFLF